MKNKDEIVFYDEFEDKEYILSRKRLEHLREVCRSYDTTIKSLEAAIDEKRITNFLFTRLLKGYPENGGVCHVSVAEVDEVVKDRLTKYGLFDPFDEIIDRLNKELDSLNTDTDLIADNFDNLDIFSAFFELEGNEYTVTAIDKPLAKAKGVEWVIDRYEQEYGNEFIEDIRDKLKLEIEEWLA